ncbi:MAG: hypothetical protein CMK59_08090 [Proteobacteria bacterium]|nr:hypothetical protein [Pseudomonadota bacterium]
MIYLFILLGCDHNLKDTASIIEVVIPEGEPPNFDMPSDGAAFISVENVYAEYEAGRSFIFLDARPSVDYNLQHITGAYSIPFYEVEDHFDAFPKDVWYIAYCACPHAESGIVAEYFLNNGHNTVGILDEGYLEWEEQGYPTENGP